MSENITLEEQRKKIGNTLGPSEYITITQDMIDQFSVITQDPDPMHIDPAWCVENSPFKTPIAFGFLTISMITALVHNLSKYDREGRIGTGGYPLNYGFNRLRLIAPVPVDSRICATVILKEVEMRKPGQLMQTMDVTVDIEGADTPALVGEWVTLWVSEPGHDQIMSK